METINKRQSLLKNYWIYKNLYLALKAIKRFLLKTKHLLDYVSFLFIKKYIFSIFIYINSSLFFKRNIDRIFVIDDLKINNLNENKKNKIIECANKLLKHDFEFLGTQGFWDNIDWHVDPIGNKRWETKYFQFIQLIEEGSDIKIPWELNRFQHFPTIALAYRFTGQQKYLLEIENELENWIKENPYLFGINWVNPMEVSIRAINWILTVELLGGIECLSKNLSKKVISSLLQKGCFINNNIEFYRNGISTNHTISDYFGLFVLGCFFKNLTIGKNWKSTGWKGLEIEIQKQVSIDGVDYEASIPYHRYVLELFLYAFIIARREGIKISKTYHLRLLSMLYFVDSYTRPDGLAPQVGDGDDGRILILDYCSWNKRDHRYLLAIGKYIFCKEKFYNTPCYQPAEVEILLNEKDSIDVYDQPIKHLNYYEGGYYILKSSRLWAFITAHPCGTKGLGNHTHNDLGGFELCCDSIPFFVDIGTFFYSRNLKERFNFRSTVAHNTLVVDHLEQNDIEPEQIFGIGKYYDNPVVKMKFSDENVFSLSLLLPGYERLVDPVRYERIFYLHRPINQLTIQDKVFARKSHIFQWNFHCDSKVKIQKIDKNNFILKNGSSNIIFKVNSTLEIKTELIPGFVSYSYNSRVNSQIIRFTLNTTCAEIGWEIQAL